MEQDNQTQVDQLQTPQPTVQVSTISPNLSQKNWYKYRFWAVAGGKINKDNYYSSVY